MAGENCKIDLIENLFRIRESANVVTYFGAAPRVIDSLMFHRDLILSLEKPTRVANKGVR